MQRSAIIYTRVSSQQQVGNFSLDVQEEACRAYCRAKGWPVLKVFREEGESATTSARTQLNLLLDFACDRKREIAAVVVHSVSRWSRDVRDHFNLTAALSRWGIALRSATEPIDESAEGQMTEGFLSVVAKYENQQRARRTKGGMRKALEGGRWMFRAPVGYLNSGRGKRDQPSLIADPAAADMVRACFEAFADARLTEHEVQRRLAERALTMPNGQPVSRQTVSKILRNPAYCGRVLPRWGLTAKGDWEPLITEALFDRAQARLAVNGPVKPHVRENDAFALRGFVRCGACDGPLTAAMSRGRSKSYGYFWCYRCRRVRVSALAMEREFLDLLARLEPRREFMALFNAVLRDVWKNREVAVRDDRERLEQRLSDLRRRRDRVEDALADGLLKPEAYRRQMERLQRDLAVAEDALGGTVVEHLDVERILAFAEGVLCDASRLWERSTGEVRRRLQKALFPAGVTYEPGEGGGLRTAVTCLAFAGLRDSGEAESAMVALRGFEPRSDG
jgi:DNA invertase Pin-like site-specific DNA recombinase